MFVDVVTTRALGRKGGEGGIIAYKQTSTSQLPPKLMPSFNPTKQDHGVFLGFLGGKPMWIHRTAILARIFDCTPQIFDVSVSTLASLGANYGAGKNHKASLRELTSTLRGKHFVVMSLIVFQCRFPTFILAI